MNFIERVETRFSKEDWKEDEVELWAGWGVDEGEFESEDFLRLSTSVAYATRRSKPVEMASCHSCLLVLQLLSTAAVAGEGEARQNNPEVGRKASN